MLDVKVGVVPRIRSILCNLSIGVAPISSSPIGGNVRDTRMTDGSSEEVGFRLQVLRHKSAITGSHTSHLLGIYIGVFCAECTCAFNDVICCHISPGIDVTGCKLLSKSDGTGGFQNKNNITHVGES